MLDGIKNSDFGSKSHIKSVWISLVLIELGSVHKNWKQRKSRAENQFPNFTPVHCVRISRAKARKVWNSAQTRPRATINKRTHKLHLHSPLKRSQGLCLKRCYGMTGISNDEMKRKVEGSGLWVTLGKPVTSDGRSKTLKKQCECVCLSVEHFLGNGFKVTALCSDWTRNIPQEVLTLQGLGYRMQNTILCVCSSQ